MFVIYSESEYEAYAAGFWSNADGWVPVEQATRFSKDERDTMTLPSSRGNDARWLPAWMGWPVAGDAETLQTDEG